MNFLCLLAGQILVAYGRLECSKLWWGGAAGVPELHYSNLLGDKQSMGFLAQLGLCARLLIIPH